MLAVYKRKISNSESVLSKRFCHHAYWPGGISPVSAYRFKPVRLRRNTRTSTTVTGMSASMIHTAPRIKHHTHSSGSICTAAAATCTQQRNTAAGVATGTQQAIRKVELLQTNGQWERSDLLYLPFAIDLIMIIPCHNLGDREPEKCRDKR